MNTIYRHLILIPSIVLSVTFTSNAELYLGTSVGRTEVDDFCGGTQSGLTCDNSDTSYKIFGGYQFNKNFALEAAYIDISQVTAEDGSSKLTVESTAFNLSAVGIAPISDAVDFFGKIGVMSWETKAEVSGLLVSSNEASGSDITFGLGFDFGLGEHFALRLEAERFNGVGDESTAGQSSITFISLGAIVIF